MTIRVEAQRRRLDLLVQPTPPEGERCAEKDLPLVVKTLARVEPTVRWTVAVCPIVIARREDSRSLQGVKKTESLRVQSVATGGRRH